jgi:anti-sigma B factor antagonist
VTILEVDTRQGDGTARVLLRGELDLSTVDKVEDALRRVEQDEPPVVVLDLSALTFLDSTGLRTIVTADQRARRGDRRLVVVKGPETVHRVFTITRLDERLEMVDDADSALSTPPEA